VTTGVGVGVGVGVAVGVCVGVGVEEATTDGVGWGVAATTDGVGVGAISTAVAGIATDVTKVAATTGTSAQVAIKRRNLRNVRTLSPTCHA
jgi:hypothetical protein